MGTETAVKEFAGTKTRTRERNGLLGITGAGYEVIVKRLDVGAAVLRASTALLSEDERRRADRLVFDRERRRFIEARAGLRRLVASRLQIRPEAVEFSYGAHGKPQLAGPVDGTTVHFNHSRYEDVAVYAFSNDRAVGVDVEGVRSIRDADSIARGFFSPREQVDYLSLHPYERVEGFFNCWTRKEAFIKALGGGLSLPLDRFDVTLSPHEPARLLRIEDDDAAPASWSLASWTPAPGCVAAIAARRRER